MKLKEKIKLIEKEIETPRTHHVLTENSHCNTIGKENWSEKSSPVSNI